MGGQQDLPVGGQGRLRVLADSTPCVVAVAEGFADGAVDLLVLARCRTRPEVSFGTLI